MRTINEITSTIYRNSIVFYTNIANPLRKINEVDSAISIQCDASNKDDIIIPCIIKELALINIVKNFESSYTLVAPLSLEYSYSRLYQNSRKSGSTLFRDILNYSRSLPSLVFIKDENTDDIFYGSRGIVFYPDGTPMVLMAIRCSIKKRNANTFTLDNVRPLLYINGEVYFRDDIVSKYVRGKFLTDFRTKFFTNESENYILSISYKGGNINGSSITFKDASIIIGNEINNFISNPKLPSSASNEDINSFIVEHKDCLLKTINNDL